MLVLSDEPKAIVAAAERLMDLDANIRNLFTIDTLAFRINDYMMELRKRNMHGGFIGTAGFTVMYWNWTEDGEEFNIFLNIGAFHRSNKDEPTQQFVDNDGPWQYDESCPPDWRDDEE